MNPTAPLAPGSVIGIIGGGQLGRMTALAAARLGYRCHILTPEPNSPAGQVAERTVVTPYDDGGALESFARAVDVVTFEFENIPVECVRHLARFKPTRPNADVLAVAQDRIEEKTFINELDIATAPWRTIRSVQALDVAARDIGLPAVLKTAQLGYDGKGQVKIAPGDDLAAAWKAMGAEWGILEGFIDLEREISVIVARGLDGAMAAYPAVENVHTRHILDTTTAPARIAPALAERARQYAEAITAALGVVGLLAVEMFVARDGRLLVNEIAPRPHNSGHWTLDACPVSQFEQLVRAITGLPLGTVERHSDAIMTNLIGRDVESWPKLAAEPGACLHLYGKGEAREGRKMGHVTRLFPKGSLAQSGAAKLNP
ncbi:MAG: 5-(carboxyamino)imidazole ribonucleotide synthase [Alphaproteobacteria bacterium]|nr:5-(carboxyamino)imidazole ribonucleotide synthase [Alphaproteobacteria bacterium]MBM3950457.1 5-(carboxyamino)imidazole ribonucleotide synthase [Rhodospirillales bacterium]